MLKHLVSTVKVLFHLDYIKVSNAREKIVFLYIHVGLCENQKYETRYKCQQNKDPFFLKTLNTII